MTQQELESRAARGVVANAAVVRDGIALENAKIALGDTQVLAPITGTVIQRSRAARHGDLVADQQRQRRYGAS